MGVNKNTILIEKFIKLTTGILSRQAFAICGNLDNGFFNIIVYVVSLRGTFKLVGLGHV